MANVHFIFGFIGAIILLSGCCGSTGSSSHCTTYGEACTEFCDKSKGTQFDVGSNCFSQCMNDVKAQGLGDATTCCKKTMRNECQDACNAQLSQMVAKYGIDQAEQSDFLDGCLAECTGMYEQIGMPLDSCSLVDVSAVQ